MMKKLNKMKFLGGNRLLIDLTVYVLIVMNQLQTHLVNNYASA